MYKAVIFDCFGVLTTDTWKQFVDDLSDDVDKPKLRELNHQLDAGLLGHAEFLDQVYTVSGSKPQMVEKLLNNEMTKNTRLLDYIKTLRERGYKIGILSNISSNWIRDSFLTMEEQKLFDNFTLSYETGTTKPDPRIFEVACEGIGVALEESIFIDDIEHYCQAAESLGMRAIVYKDNDSMISELESKYLSLSTDTDV